MEAEERQRKADEEAEQRRIAKLVREREKQRRLEIAKRARRIESKTAAIVKSAILESIRSEYAISVNVYSDLTEEILTRLAGLGFVCRIYEDSDSSIDLVQELTFQLKNVLSSDDLLNNEAFRRFMSEIYDLDAFNDILKSIGNIRNRSGYLTALSDIQIFYAMTDRFEEFCKESIGDVAFVAQFDRNDADANEKILYLRVREIFRKLSNCIMDLDSELFDSEEDDTVEDDEEDGVDESAVELEVMVSWRSADWKKNKISDVLGAYLANWFASAQGRNVLSNIDRLVTEAAAHEDTEIGLEIETWPANESRWGPNNAYRLSHASVPIGIFPADPSLLSQVLTIMGFNIKTIAASDNLISMKIAW